MKFLRFLIAGLALVPASIAEAAVYRFDYKTKPIYCQTEWCAGDTLAQTWSGYFLVDTDLVPGRTIASTTFDLSWEVLLPQRSASAARVSSPLIDQTFTFAPPSESLDWSAVGITQIGGYLHYLLGYTIYSGQYRISFDAQGRVSSWYGHNMQGGSNDPASSVYGDGDWDYWSDGPGTWVRTLVSGEPSPVPLPGSSSALLCGIAGLAAIAMARRRRG